MICSPYSYGAQSERLIFRSLRASLLHLILPFAAIRPDCVTAAAEASLVFYETTLFSAFDGAAAAVSARVLPFFRVADVFDSVILLAAIVTVTAQDAETISRNNRSCLPR